VQDDEEGGSGEEDDWAALLSSVEFEDPSGHVVEWTEQEKVF